MGVLYDTARVVKFSRAEQRSVTPTSTYTGEMQGVHGLCRYVEADPITMTIDIDMAFGRGPAATSDRQTYRYWVAVTRRGRAPIEPRQYFDVDVRFPRGEAGGHAHASTSTTSSFRAPMATSRARTSRSWSAST